MKKLPIGIDSFKEIITDNHCYVDKTKLIHQLVKQGKYYFLSRPRRFGKSLLIDTIYHAFQGNKALFNGLFLENNWNWDKKHPVIHIDLAESVMKSPDRLEQRLHRILAMHAAQAGLTLNCSHVDDCFEELIQKLHHKNKHRVVVLVDEYDKPILDNITTPETALEIRESLRNFYSVLKAQRNHLRFVMLTGVSKFSKVSLFSGLNNLKDITLDKRYGAICGYTQNELESTFHEYMKGLDSEKIKKWYNGYNFLAEPVYNPFDVLLYLDEGQFHPYWFETGTPTFLIRLIREAKLCSGTFEGMKISHRFLGSFDVNNIKPQPLLFQTGYLTIKALNHDSGGVYYTLGFPNHEVRYAFNDALLAELTQADAEQDDTKLALSDALNTNNLDRLKQIFHTFFASIPYDWYRKNDMAGYEGYYCSIVYSYFTAQGLQVSTEDATNHGRIDMTVHFNDRIYIIEFKVNELTKSDRALAQIKEKRYYEKYTGKEIYLIGIEFSKKNRNITRFEWEKM
ncbi:ATP-binding protein [Desulfobacter latus]|uniref:ATP-binding protein n=1 Tax=Desulfobacter latus TaxID=2292 RepID=A0A850SW41_9BACT|nr:ATP-binding protein [Desulfobacter latus]NWH05554.1 ATP-binding protein [Desulfobacter latus]